jgi:hypothetical protein
MLVVRIGESCHEFGSQFFFKKIAHSATIRSLFRSVMSAGGNSKSRVMWRLERRGVARDAAAPELTIIIPHTLCESTRFAS